MAQEEMRAAVDALGLTMTAKFVPFSQSRDKAAKSPSLNWRVTIKANGRDVIETDYMQGSGHCPAAQSKWLGTKNSVDRAAAIAKECETGKRVVAESKAPGHRAHDPIHPDICDVLYSLASDAEALDCAAFDEWASNYGYDVDSRKAEATYRACLKIALKLRAGVGDAGLMQLREACRDY